MNDCVYLKNNKNTGLLQPNYFPHLIFSETPSVFSPPTLPSRCGGSYTLCVGPPGGEEGAEGGDTPGGEAYRQTVERIRSAVTEKFEGSKRELMLRLERERLDETRANNASLARRYEDELRLLTECQMEELENVHVAIKVRAV